ncbi:MAG: hypothetical protein U9Q76_02500 [candidate division WOR-3 bacterium]|nr:hypothetical protein [candidate division WOR-3 bacterium]
MVCLVLISMISTTDSLRAEFRATAQEWIQNAEDQGWVIDSVDALVLERTMEEFGPYLEEELGSRKSRRILARVDTPDELSSVLDRFTGKRFGEFYFKFYAWAEKRSVAEEIWLMRESEHFIYLYHPWSAAEKDIRLIEAVAEQSFNQITDILRPDSFELARLSRIVRTDEVPLRYSQGKIPLRLHSTRKGLGSFEQVSGGETVFRPIWHEDTVGYALRIDLAYPGPVGLFGLPHEMAHALALVYLSNEPLLAERVSSGEHVPANLLRDAVLTEDILRLEGWAYMVQYNHSAYVRLGMWRSSRESMDQMARVYGFPDAYLFLNGDMTRSFTEQVLSIFGFKKSARQSEMIRYLFASADLIRFLHERYGAEKLKTFLTNRKPPMDAMLEVYDLTPYALEQEWKNDVLYQ